MKKKGFTLIELLAGLVIIAIIALIAVPNVMNIINDSKESAVESSAQLLAKAAQDYYASQLLVGDGLDKVDLTNDTIIYNGDKPDMGYAFFDEEGRAYVKMYYNGYCVARNYDGKVELDKTSPDNCEIADMVSITLYTNGGTLTNSEGWSIGEDYASIIVKFGSKLDKMPAIEKPGYTFKGWYDSNDELVALEGSIVESLTATAKWEVNTYTVTLDLAGGVVEGDYESVRTITYGEAYGNLPTPTKLGHTFLGWYTSGGIEVTSETLLTNPNNHMLHATWEAIEYDLTLDSLGVPYWSRDRAAAYCNSSGQWPHRQ